MPADPAMRTNSKHQKKTATGMPASATQEWPMITMSEIPIRISRCPASMFANNRTLSETRRRNCESTSSGTISSLIAPETGGTQLLKYGTVPFVLEPDVVRREECDQCERERHRQVRRGRVERGRRNRAPDLVLGVDRQRQVRDQVVDEMNTNSVATYGNHVVYVFAGSDSAADLALAEVVDHLDDGLQALRMELEVASDEQRAEHDDGRRQQQVEDALRDREVDWAHLRDLDPRLEQELLGGVGLERLAGSERLRRQRQHQRHPGGGPEQAAHHASPAFGSRLDSAQARPRARLSIV